MIGHCFRKTIFLPLSIMGFIVFSMPIYGEYSDSWWSLEPIKKADPPSPESDNSAWLQNPIDRFILDSLIQRGLKPSKPTSPEELIRRVYFDLIGLPPTPEDIKSFVSQCKVETSIDGKIGPKTYKKIIHTLLNSPQYGERWARHWLDLVHFGETHGFDKDQRRNNAWPYRDYVIRAFNEDKAYPEFVSEQIAGDILKPNHPDGAIATGFLASGPWDFVGQKEVREGTVEKKRVRNLDRDDIVTNVFTTFLSTTVQCARCHDHKFDPVAINEYYNIQSIFSNRDRGESEYETVEAALTRSLLTDKIKFEKDILKKTEAEIRKLFSPEYLLRETALQGYKDQFKQWEDEQKVKQKSSPTNGYHSTISLTNKEEHWVQVNLDKPTPLKSIHLIPAHPTDFKDTPGFGFPIRYTVTISTTAEGEDFTPIADHSKILFKNPGNNPVILTLKNTPVQRIRITAHELWERNNDYVFALAELQAYSGDTNVAYKANVTASSSIDFGRWHTKNLVDGYGSRKRLSTTIDTPDSITELQSIIKEIESKIATLYQHDVTEKLRKQKNVHTQGVKKLEAEKRALPSPQKVYTVKKVEPRPIHVLTRGSVKSPGEQAHPGTIECIEEIQSKKIVFENHIDQARRTLAYWISHHNNSLTWRSITNRIWQYHFGRGIVATPNDFGKAGSLPTHPELLDYLAERFRLQPTMKDFHILILTSQTYQQSSAHNDRNATIDASNQYLWRMNRRKLDAESIRDSILSISQKLDLTMGGPGFDLFNYTHDHSPRYDYMGKDSPDVWRRSIYRFVVRSVPDPLFEALDCADPNLNTPVRNQTLTAPQALAMLNDRFMIDQATHTANYLQEQTSDINKQIQHVHYHALGRPADKEELLALRAYTKKHGLQNTTRLIFNLNEFMFVD